MNEKELEAELLRIESVLRHRLKNFKNSPKRLGGDKEAIAFENGMWFAYNLIKPIVNKIIKQHKDEEKKLERIIINEYQRPYNTICGYYQEIDGDPHCKIGMDMCFCCRDCAFSTRNNHRTRR